MDAATSVTKAAWGSRLCSASKTCSVSCSLASSVIRAPRKLRPYNRAKYMEAQAYGQCRKAGQAHDISRLSPIPFFATLNSVRRQGTDPSGSPLPFSFTCSSPRLPEDAMIRKHVRPRQPDFVMPPLSATPCSNSQVFTLPTAVVESHHALTTLSHDEIHQPPLSPQLPVIRGLRYTCVSYGPATTTLQMLHFSDTNHRSPDTKSVACSYLSVAPVPPGLPPPHHDGIRQSNPAPEIPRRGTVWSNTNQLRQWD